jgi:hypothetical protein
MKRTILKLSIVVVMLRASWAPAAGIDSTWEVTMPAGAKFEMILRKISDDEYELQKARVFTGTYSKDKEGLVLIQSTNKQIDKMVWKIVSPDKMVLRVSETRNGGNYTDAKAVMIQPWKPTTQPEPKRNSQQILLIVDPLPPQTIESSLKVTMPADAPSSYDRKKIDETPDLVQTCAAANFYKDGGLYCGPVAVSDSLVWLIKKELLSYPYSNTEDQYSLVKMLATDKYLKTNKHEGTGVYSLTTGLQIFLNDYGVTNSTIKHSGWRACKDEYQDQQDVTLEWIESHIKGTRVEWLNIGWYRREGKVLRRVGGHWLTVVGYRNNTCYALDPSPRNGKKKVVHKLSISPAVTRDLNGNFKGLPATSEGMLEIKRGFKLKSIADICLIDSAVSLQIE